MTTGRLRVLMITGRADVGGGPEHLFQLSKSLAGDCDVFIASPNESPYWERYRNLVGESRLFEIPHRRFSGATLWALSKWCGRNRIDLVHSHGRAAGAYSRLIPRSDASVCLHTPHGSVQLRTVKDVGLWLAELMLARKTNRLIAVSHSELRHLRRWMFRGAHLTVIPNGVPLPATTVAPNACSSTPKRIVHVTRFVTQKNSGMVLAILSQLRRAGRVDSFHVDMLGDGPDRSALEREARRLGLDRHMTFHGAQNSIAPFLGESFCLLTTSLWEGMPLAVLEALAHGLPVVASDTPGNNDIITPEVGRLFPVSDPSIAADHLLELASNQETWTRISTAAAVAARTHYSIERMTLDTRLLYERTLARAA